MSIALWWGWGGVSQQPPPEDLGTLSEEKVWEGMGRQVRRGGVQSGRGGNQPEDGAPEIMGTLTSGPGPLTHHLPPRELLVMEREEGADGGSAFLLFLLPLGGVHMAFPDSPTEPAAPTSRHSCGGPSRTLSCSQPQLGALLAGRQGDRKPILLSLGGPAPCTLRFGGRGVNLIVLRFHTCKCDF